MLKAVIFDFDGVIVDSEPLHYRAFMEVLNPLGFDIDYATYLSAYVGFDDRDFFREALRVMQQHGRSIAELDVGQLLGDKAAAVERLIERGLTPIPGIVPLIEACAATWPIAIASGALRGEIERIARGIGIYDQFELVVAADEVAQSKPHPETYAEAAAQLAARHPELNLRPGECLAIEDTPTGIESARAAGLMTLAVSQTVGPEQLQRADRIVAGFEKIDVNTLRAWYDDHEAAPTKERHND